MTVVQNTEHSRILLDSTAIRAGSSYNFFGSHYAIPTNGYRGALLVDSINGNFKAYIPPVGNFTGVNFNTGDTDASYKTTFIGTNEASLNAAEIADSVVYAAGAGLKFSHQNNADIEAGVGYAALEITNDVTFHVNGSYQF